MNKLLIPAFLVLALSLLGCSGKETTSGATAPGQIPLKDFFRNPEKAAFELSPDGKWIAFLAPFESRLNIFVQSVGKAEDGALKPMGEPERVTSIKDRDLSGYFWKGNQTLLFAKDNGGDENFHVYSVDIKAKEPKDLTPFDKVKASVVDDLEDISATDVLVAHNQRNPEVFDVYRLNVTTGKLNLVAENPGNVTDWTTDHKGRVRGAMVSDGLTSRFLFRDSEKAKFKKSFEFDYKTSVSPALFTFDDKNIYAFSNINRDKVALVKMDPRNGKELQKIYENPEVDLDSLSHSKKRKVLTAVHYTDWKGQLHFLDAKAEKRYKKVAAELPGKEVSFSSRNKAEDLFVVTAWSDRSRSVYYLYDDKTGTLTEIAKSAPWLDESKLAQVKPISYKSRDGLTIHGYLTLPPGKEAKNLPVVVNPHGGPWARDNWGFDSEAQFLANRGMAVFQMNFRGSTGYGRKFWEASFKQWGKAMQDDVTDGVKWLIEQKIADPKRIAIYGGSYGGYATLAGLTFTPDLYACGVDYVGVANLFTFMNSIPPYWKPYLERLHAMVGHPEKDKELLTSSSPVFHVDKIKVPLLVVQGAKDPRVNKNESDQVVESLKKRGIDVPYLVKDNEGHGFRNEENRFEFYQTMEAFLKKHLHL